MRCVCACVLCGKERVRAWFSNTGRICGNRHPLEVTELLLRSRCRCCNNKIYHVMFVYEIYEITQLSRSLTCMKCVIFRHHCRSSPANRKYLLTLLASSTERNAFVLLCVCVWTEKPRVGSFEYSYEANTIWVSGMARLYQLWTVCNNWVAKKDKYFNNNQSFNVCV